MLWRWPSRYCERSDGGWVQTGKVILVPGNHDRRFLAPWIQAMGTRLSVDSSAPLDATPELDAVSSWLAPAQVSARYPGVWLSERVWATHGHYLTRTLGPAWSLGVTRGRLGRLSHEVARPIDYEPAGGRSLRSAHEAISGALPEPLAEAADRLGVLARAATMAKASRKLLRPELARANSGLLCLQTKVASIPSLIHVAQCLGVDATTSSLDMCIGWVRCQAMTRPTGRAPAAGRGSSIPGHGSTSRCLCKTQPRHTLTGRAAQPSSSTRQTRSRSGSWTRCPRASCSDVRRTVQTHANGDGRSLTAS